MLKLRFFTFSSILFAIFIPHLAQLNYGPFSFEILAFIAISIGLGMVLAVVTPTPVTFGVIMGLGIYFLIDLYFANLFWAPFVFVGCVFGAIVLLRYAPAGLPLAVGVFAVVFALPSVFAPQTPLLRTVAGEGTITPRTDIAYLHLILDEQGSPIASGGKIRANPAQETVLATYLDRDFKTYGLAMSDSSLTHWSLSSLFALEEKLQNAGKGTQTYTWLIRSNRLVPALLDAGFDTTVIESDFLRLCGDDPRATCATYSRGQDMQVVADQGWSFGKRIFMAGLQLHNDYLFAAPRTVRLYQAILKNGAELLGQRPSQSYQMFIRPLAMLEVLDDLSARVADMQAGDAIIAHLLVPHSPYVLGPDCSYRDLSEWGYVLESGTHVGIAQAYDTFWDQSACLHSRLAEMLDQLRGREDVVVIIHGDHGSRILDRTVDARPDDSLGTLLAIKAPYTTGRLIDRPVGLQDVFFEEFKALVGPQP